MENKTKNSNFVNRVNNLAKVFFEHFNCMPKDAFTSPGRIELLGNHTDHNNGLVLVSSIDLNILSLATPTYDDKITIYSKGFPLMEIDINDLEIREKEYGESIGMARGVIYKFKELGYKIGGLRVATSTTIFKGAGVSSSAAFELMIAKLLSYYYNEDSINPVELAKIAQFAETTYFNKPCGLLDQMGISLGSINFIDFRSTDNPYIRTLRSPLVNYDIVLVNCKDSHSSLTHLYAKIKEDMSLISSYFNKKVLREVKEKDFYKSKDDIIEKFGEDVFLRGKHYFEENNRVRKAKEAIIKKDEKGFLEMVNESGESSFYQLKNCYNKSVNENLPRGILKSKEIIKDGAVRVHGGGFAGTLLAFTSKQETDSYIKEMRKMFGYNNVKRIATNRFGTRFICPVDEVLSVEQVNQIKGEEND